MVVLGAIASLFVFVIGYSASFLLTPSVIAAASLLTLSTSFLLTTPACMSFLREQEWVSAWVHSHSLIAGFAVIGALLLLMLSSMVPYRFYTDTTALIKISVAHFLCFTFATFLLIRSECITLAGAYIPAFLFIIYEGCTHDAVLHTYVQRLFWLLTLGISLAGIVIVFFDPFAFYPFAEGDVIKKLFLQAGWCGSSLYHPDIYTTSLQLPLVLQSTMRFIIRTGLCGLSIIQILYVLLMGAAYGGPSINSSFSLHATILRKSLVIWCSIYSLLAVASLTGVLPVFGDSGLLLIAAPWYSWLPLGMVLVFLSNEIR